VCGLKGKSLLTLFKKLNVESKVTDELNLILGNTSTTVFSSISTKLVLPKEFKSLSTLKSSDITGKHALSYLKKRGITELDILKYNIGYCENGIYANRIIIPSYDAQGILNYFTGRTFDKNNNYKYKNPSVSRDIIPFELFINWNLPIVLCEGPMDALAIKRNAIPLLGKTISNSLMKKIICSSVDKIYIALDKDAIKEALKFCEKLMNEGKEVYLVELNDKDPSTLGFENFTKLIQNTYSLTFTDLLEKKLAI